MLVTGASGFVGGEIALELHNSGYRVTALVRSGSDRAHLSGRDITFVEGDITDPDAVTKAVDGQDFVCHAAALVPGNDSSDDEFRRVNAGGTRIICDAAIDAGVNRLVFVSTTHVFGFHPGSRVDEHATPSAPPHAGYDASKVEAEAVLLDHAAGSLDAVIINPTAVYGPRSRYSGRLIKLFIKGRLPVIPIPDKILSLVHSRDVALGARLALEQGCRGERYILAGTNVTVREFIEALALVSGRRTPLLSVPGWVMAAGVAALWAASPLTRWRPPMTVAGIRGGGTIYDGNKATRELGLEYTPIDLGLAATVEWMTRED